MFSQNKQTEKKKKSSNGVGGGNLVVVSFTHYLKQSQGPTMSPPIAKA
jgi:hypothetical protein